ncbi:MAG: hypothetical protein GY940_39400, partial [bacterium]|nr:hypothetical protein [bacterium]
SNYHILYDGWSTGIILKEFLNAYNDLVNGRRLEIPVKTKFKEFVRWVQNRDVNEDRRFWGEYLNGFDAKSLLSVKRQTGRKSEVKRYTLEIPETLTDGVIDFVKKKKVTMASILYSTWGILLQKYNNGSHVMFGTTAGSRTTSINDVGNIVGLFINTIPLVIKSPGDSTLLELVRNISDSLKIRKKYESHPLMDIRAYSRLDPEKDPFASTVVIEN